MKEKVVVFSTVIAHPGKEAPLREGLLGLVAFAKTEPGFIQYDLHESVDRPGHFAFYEIWENERSLELHSNTPEMKAFGAKARSWIQSATLDKYKLL